MNISFGNLFTEDLAVDLGTVHTFIYARSRGMVVNEPSLVAIDRVTHQVIAVGTEALEMLGRSPEDVEIAYPMQSGVVADSNLAQTYTIVVSPQTAEQIRLGRELGGKIADRLVEDIRDMGMPVTRAFTSATTTTHPNDIVIRGYLASIDEGSATKRMAIGFGSGSSELRTVVEGLQVTPQGLRMLGSATVEAKGGVDR